MESSKLGSWLQIAANVGILAGLILVSVQIVQSNAITGAELFSDNLESTVNRELALVGENPEVSMFRVLVEPEEASAQDYFVADRVYLATFKQFNRARLLADAGLYGAKNTLDATGFVRANFHMFSCPYGLAWLDQLLSAIPSEDPRHADLKLMHELASERMYRDPMADRIRTAEKIAGELRAAIN